MSKTNIELVIATCVENNDGKTEKNIVKLNLASEDGQVRVEPRNEFYFDDVHKNAQLNAAPQPPRLAANTSIVKFEERVSDTLSDFKPWTEYLPSAEVKALPPAHESHETRLSGRGNSHKGYIPKGPYDRGPYDQYAPETGHVDENAYQDRYEHSRSSAQPRDSRGRFVSRKREVYYPPTEDVGLYKPFDEVDLLEMELQARDEIKKTDDYYKKGVMPKYPIYIALGAVTIAALAFAYERISSTDISDRVSSARTTERAASVAPGLQVPDLSDRLETYSCSGETYIAVSRKLTGAARYAKQIVSYNKQHNPDFNPRSKRCYGKILVPPDVPRSVRKNKGWTRHKVGNRGLR